MKSSLLSLMTNDSDIKNDHYQTPDEALYPLLRTIRYHTSCFASGSANVYDPACGARNIVRFFQNLGYASYGSDILEGADFFEIKEMIPRMDMIITNPPYSLKDRFLEHALSFKIPVAFLMNLNSLGTARRQKIFQKNKLQLILLGGRTHYLDTNGNRIGNGSAWFESAWFCFGFNFRNDIVYEHLGNVSSGSVVRNVDYKFNVVSLPPEGFSYPTTDYG